LVQAVVSTLNDYFLYKLARTYFDGKSAKWALLCTLFSWFLFYVMVRPFSNTIETVFTTAALAYWPWAFQVHRRGEPLHACSAELRSLLSVLKLNTCMRVHDQDAAAVAKKTDGDASPVQRSQGNRTLALSLAALGVLFRPTNAIIWVYPGLMLLLKAKDKLRLIFLTVLPIAAATIGAMLVIDRIGYGEWTFVPYNFVKFNVIEVCLPFG
jgi:phosphatidylinositol glycan class B